jgi:hypothetical protein
MIFARLEQQPFLILLPILVLVLVSTKIFDRAFRLHAIAPTSHDEFQRNSWSGPFQAAYPRFNGFIYSLENTNRLLTAAARTVPCTQPAMRRRLHVLYAPEAK